MSVKDVYILGPLELSQGHLAVGWKSYAAIKGKWPVYNIMREDLYRRGEKDIADAIGALQAQVNALEEDVKDNREKVSKLSKQLTESNKRVGGLTTSLERTKLTIVELNEKLNARKASSVNAKEGS